MTVLYFARYLVVTLILATAVVFAWWSASEDR
jgi:glucose-6-phosphate dehydrogenase assembly protein OpcA